MKKKLEKFRIELLDSKLAITVLKLEYDKNTGKIKMESLKKRRRDSRCILLFKRLKRQLALNR